MVRTHCSVSESPIIVKERLGLVIATVSVSACCPSTLYGMGSWRITIQSAFLSKKTNFVLRVASNKAYNDSLGIFSGQFLLVALPKKTCRCFDCSVLFRRWKFVSRGVSGRF